MSRFLTHFAARKQSFFSVISRSNSAAIIPNSSSFLFGIRPLVAAASFSSTTQQTSSSFLSDLNPDSFRPSKEYVLSGKCAVSFNTETLPREPGCDYEHWFVKMEEPRVDATRDEIIDSYIKTLAMVVESEEEARKRIYFVSTRYYFAFGALVSEELSCKIKELPDVVKVIPDAYVDVENKEYGGEPFINGQAVPYDPKYHEPWVRVRKYDRRLNKCRRCGELGHNQRTCKQTVN